MLRLQHTVPIPDLTQKTNYILTRKILSESIFDVLSTVSNYFMKLSQSFCLFKYSFSSLSLNNDIFYTLRVFLVPFCPFWDTSPCNHSL